MLELEGPIKEEYDRFLKQIEESKHQPRSGGLSAVDVLRAHFLIANHFYLEGGELGGIGPKSIDMLLSALDRQNVSLGKDYKWNGVFDICATIFYGLIKNHPFHDANKRTAFLSALYMLYVHGWCPSVSEKDFEDFTVEVAEGTLNKYSRYKDLVRRGDLDADVKFISHYLRKNTRKLDKSYRTVTFRELSVILERYGFRFGSANGNYIDILGEREKTKFFGRKYKETYRVCTVGFPRWTAEVSKAAMKTIRESTGLSAKDGVDTASFFDGVDDMQSLMTTYNRPLMSLANR